MLRLEFIYSQRNRGNMNCIVLQAHVECAHTFTHFTLSEITNLMVLLIGVYVLLITLRSPTYFCEIVYFHDSYS